MADLLPLGQRVEISATIEELRAYFHDHNENVGICDHSMPDNHPPERWGYERDCRSDADTLARRFGAVEP